LDNYLDRRLAVSSPYYIAACSQDEAAETHNNRSTLITLKGGAVYVAREYWVEGVQMRCIGDNGKKKLFALETIDLNQTVRLNRERNIKFIVQSRDMLAPSTAISPIFRNGGGLALYECEYSTGGHFQVQYNSQSWIRLADFQASAELLRFRCARLASFECLDRASQSFGQRYSTDHWISLVRLTKTSTSNHTTPAMR
jgi:hypothetical protein